MTLKPIAGRFNIRYADWKYWSCELMVKRKKERRKKERRRDKVMKGKCGDFFFLVKFHTFFFFFGGNFSLQPKTKTEIKTAKINKPM